MLRSIIQRYAKSKMWKRWWLSHATDFQSVMYPCFMVCRILGIFPYKINASIFEISRPQYIISTVIVCICCIFEVIFAHDVIVSKLDLGDITKNFEILNYHMFSCFILIITHMLSGPRMRLLQTILKISSKLSSESYQKLSRLIYVKDILGIIFLIVQRCTYIFTKYNEYKLTLIRFVIESYWYVLVFETNMLYINCVCVLKACFKSINDNLTHMQILMTNDIKLRDIRIIRHVQRNQSLLTELKFLEKWHLRISDAVKMMNIIFSLQLIAIIVMSFANVTFQVYFYAVRWQDGIFFSFDMYFIVGLLTTMAYYVLIIILLIWACETGKNQAQQVNTTVHNVLNTTNNKEIKNELQLFSLQILHQENIFSVKGLAVDATLLTALMGNITTYLLILIQFLTASHSCDRKIPINIM